MLTSLLLVTFKRDLAAQTKKNPTEKNPTVFSMYLSPHNVYNGILLVILNFNKIRASNIFSLSPHVAFSSYFSWKGRRSQKALLDQTKCLSV